VKPQDDQRLSDHVALGVLTRTFPPGLVDVVIESTGRAEQRNRLLPARLVVYYVLALALFSQSGYEEVMRSLRRRPRLGDRMATALECAEPAGNLAGSGTPWRRAAQGTVQAGLRSLRHRGHPRRLLPALATDVD